MVVGQIPADMAILSVWRGTGRRTAGIANRKRFPPRNIPRNSHSIWDGGALCEMARIPAGWAIRAVVINHVERNSLLPPEYGESPILFWMPSRHVRASSPTSRASAKVFGIIFAGFPMRDSDFGRTAKRAWPDWLAVQFKLGWGILFLQSLLRHQLKRQLAHPSMITLPNPMSIEIGAVTRQPVTVNC